ncbi:MAG: PEP-CTERM sorting domain-containing protein [Chthoniobacterales bacterium]
MFAACVLATVLGAASTQAQMIISISNSSFESPVTADFVSINPGLPGWEAPPFVNSYVVNTTGPTASATNVTGNQFLFLEPFADGANSYVYQRLGVNFQAGIYTLSADIGYALGAFTAGGDATANFQLLAYDGSTYNYNLGVPATTVSAATLAGHNGLLSNYSYTLTLSGAEGFIGQEIAVFLQAQTTTPGLPQNVSYDNVGLQMVPEPSTYALLALAAVGCAGYAARRRRARCP